MKGEKLPRKEKFSEWYNELLLRAEIVDVRYPAKGLCVWYPFGFAVRQRIYSILRSLLDIDHQEVLFPLLIPENEFMKEAEHIKGFEEEVYWVTKGGSSSLEMPLALRPTSETAIYPMLRLWIRSHVDLPLKIYQIVNTFRCETKHTRPLIRVREITSFKEAHTAHSTWEEAEAQVKEALKLYGEFFRRLAIPHLITKRPDWDRFPGSDYSMAVDTLMPDGKTLQIGTVHHLGTNFAKTFDVQYEDPVGEQQYVNQTCYGISERCIAAMIAVHGDDRGLVLPPETAPTQIVIIPIVAKGKDTLDACKHVFHELKDEYRVVLDNSQERPGAKYYKWEMKGVPLRVEIGPRDMEKGEVTLVRRDTFEKEAVPLSAISKVIESKLSAIHANLYEKAKQSLDSRITDCKTLDEAKAAIPKGMAKVSWCGEEGCGLEMEDAVNGEVLGELAAIEKSKCIICDKKTEKVVLMARSY
jgi:prolyl-tRNA synthetase